MFKKITRLVFYVTFGWVIALLFSHIIFKIDLVKNFIMFFIPNSKEMLSTYVQSISAMLGSIVTVVAAIVVVEIEQELEKKKSEEERANIENERNKKVNEEIRKNAIVLKLQLKYGFEKFEEAYKRNIDNMKSDQVKMYKPRSIYLENDWYERIIAISSRLDDQNIEDIIDAFELIATHIKILEDDVKLNELAKFADINSVDPIIFKYTKLITELYYSRYSLIINALDEIIIKSI